MPNSSRRDTVELKRPRARLNLLLLIPAVVVLSAAGIFANPGTVVSTSSNASRQAPAAKVESQEASLNRTNSFTTVSNATRAKNQSERAKRRNGRTID